jgi:hypothetical protein
MKAVDKIKEQWAENPITVIVVVAIASTSLAKIITAVGGYKSQSAYADQIKWKLDQK